MTSRDFCYWLQGFFEINEENKNCGLSSNQVNIMKNHLVLVFKHEIDPSMGHLEHQEELNTIHNLDKSTGSTIYRC